MRRIYLTTLASLLMTACALPTRQSATEYRAEQFVGRWTVADGTHKGREYEAQTDGEGLVMRAVADTACLPAGSIVFNGNLIKDQMIGLARFCIGSAQMSTGKMVVSIEDTSTLSAMIEGYADIHFPGVDLERVIRLTQHRDE